MPALRAQIGFVGSVVFGLTGDSQSNLVVRALSSDIRPSQDINYPDVIDGRIDRTVYWPGPRILGGNVTFPLIHEGVSGGRTCATQQNLGQTFWGISSKRDSFGRLINQFDVHVRYTDNTAFTYPACIVDSLTWNVSQGDMVQMSMDVIGGANATADVRIPVSPQDFIETQDLNSPARAVTWEDFVLRVYGDAFEGGTGGLSGGAFEVSGEQIRNFTVTLSNNAERFYTLNNKLAPQDVAARKREIAGSLTLMGRNTQLSEFAYTNQNRFTSTAGIGFGYTLGSSGTPLWATGLHGVVFEIEEIAISNDLVETNVPFTALADCEANYEATQVGSSTNLNRPQGSNYGGPTSVGFPGFGT